MNLKDLRSLYPEAEILGHLDQMLEQCAGDLGRTTVAALEKSTDESYSGHLYRIQVGGSNGKAHLEFDYRVNPARLSSDGEPYEEVANLCSDVPGQGAALVHAWLSSAIPPSHQDDYVRFLAVLLQAGPILVIRPPSLFRIGGKGSCSIFFFPKADDSKSFPVYAHASYQELVGRHGKEAYAPIRGVQFSFDATSGLSLLFETSGGFLGQDGVRSLAGSFSTGVVLHVGMESGVLVFGVFHMLAIESLLKERRELTETVFDLLRKGMAPQSAVEFRSTYEKARAPIRFEAQEAIDWMRVAETVAGSSAAAAAGRDKSSRPE